MQTWFAQRLSHWSAWSSVKFKQVSPLSSATAPLKIDVIHSKCIIFIITFIIWKVNVHFWMFSSFVSFAIGFLFCSRYFLRSLSSFFFLSFSHQHNSAFYAGLPSQLDPLSSGDHFDMFIFSYFILNSLYSSSVLLVFLTHCSRALFSSISNSL